MRRMLLGTGCVLLLACGGLVEDLAESVTGGEIDIREDGMELDLPDGMHVSMDWGEAARHPGTLDLSPPPGGDIQLSGTTATPGKPEASFAIYQATGDPRLVFDRYRQELSARGLSVEEGTGEDGSLELTAEQDGILYLVSISEREDGGLTVVLGQGPPEELAQGLDANPR